MVGSAATMRLEKMSLGRAHDVDKRARTAGLVIFPSCIGTLKSTRMRARLSLRLTSVMESLLESDMVCMRRIIFADSDQRAPIYYLYHNLSHCR